MNEEIQSTELILLNPFDVTSADCDINGRLRAGGLVNYFILSAINSAEKLGFGYNGLRSRHLFWVLSRMTIEIYKPLKWFDKAIVETWPKDVEGLLYLRDFIVKDQQDEIVAKCTSGWLAIDIQSKRPRKVEEKFSYIFDRMKNCHALQQLPDKLGPVTNGNNFNLNTTWFDFDLNKHVTSTRYVDWMFDTLPMDYLINHYPTNMSINFLKEILPGESIVLTQSSDRENLFLFEGRNPDDGSVKFRGKVTFSDLGQS